MLVVASVTFIWLSTLAAYIVFRLLIVFKIVFTSSSNIKSIVSSRGKPLVTVKNNLSISILSFVFILISLVSVNVKFFAIKLRGISKHIEAFKGYSG